MDDLLVGRFERYFRHPDYSHEVLEVGDSAVGCKNLRTALRMLRIPINDTSSDSKVFDEALQAAVTAFQQQFGHRVADGKVGPGTRRLLTAALLQRFSPNIFHRLERPETMRQSTVFLSYASSDAPKVNKLDQWLRDRAVRVFRDETSFQAGTTLQESIHKA